MTKAKIKKSAAFKQKINKQDTRHGSMEMPFASLNRLAGKAKGGNVKKFAEGGWTSSVSFDAKDAEARAKKWAEDHPKKAPKVTKAASAKAAPATDDGGGKSFLSDFSARADASQKVQDAKPKSQPKNYGDTEQAPKFDPLASTKAIGKGIALGSMAAGLPEVGAVRGSSFVGDAGTAALKSLKKRGVLMRNVKKAKEFKDAQAGKWTDAYGLGIKKGGVVKGFARGGGVEIKGKTKGRFI